MTIEERFKRHDIEDQIYLGDLVEKALSGDFGLLIKAIVNGLQAQLMAMSETDTKMPADRYLGRMEGMNKLIDQLEFCIIERDRLMTDQKDAGQVKGPEDPSVQMGPTT